MAPEIAITAPTERSMPRVAITSTMPSDSSATGAPRLKTSIRLPNSRPSCSRRSKNCGDTGRSIARIDQKREDLRQAAARQAKHFMLHHACRGVRTVVGGNRRQDRRARSMASSFQRADMGAIAQHDDPIGIGDDLVEFGRNHQQRQAAVAELANEPDDLGMGADIDAARRFVQHQDARRGREPARQQHLLLVAAGQQPDRTLRLRRADVEQPDEAACDLVLLGAETAAWRGRAWPAAPARCSRAR